MKMARMYPIKSSLKQRRINSRLKPIRVLLVSAILGRKITVNAMRRPILTGAGVFDPKKGAMETTGAILHIPKPNRASVEIGATSLSFEKKER